MQITSFIKLIEKNDDSTFWKLYVKDFNAQTHSIRVNETTTLREMKKLIKQKLGNLKQYIVV